MKNSINLFFVLFLGILIIGSVSATEQSLGTFKQNDCVSLLQICANCTSVNITSVSYPNSSQAIGVSEMTATGSEYNYTFCSTDAIGTYNVNGIGDLDGTLTAWAYTFDITPSGFKDTLGFYFILIVLCGGMIVLGFGIKEGWLVIMGSMALMIMGIYSIFNGIAGFQDALMTNILAALFIGIGAYLAINSALEMMDTELN